MKLISLEMKNFRQHLDSHITFSDGVTGIIGTNGAGKSTVLEAVAWALYGAPAIRGTNDTIRSKASEGGAKVNVVLCFDLGGSVYKITRTLDAAGRSGSAVLEVDGRPLRSGMSEVTAAVTKLLGMDYTAFFTSFFTGQKQLEFMAAMDGRQRAASIGRMLGFDRLTKARDAANEDRKGLNREIEGLEKGLPDPEDLKARKKSAASRFAEASAALKNTEVAHKAAFEAVEKLKPLKEASDQKAKRQDEISRRLEIDRADSAGSEARLKQLTEELADLETKRKELDRLQPDLEKFEQAKEEFRKLAELQKYEGEKQRISGQITALEQDIDRLNSKLKHLADVEKQQLEAQAMLTEAEKLLSGSDAEIQVMREDKVAREHSLSAQIQHLNARRKEVLTRREKIAEAGVDGKCPTCERILADELPRVLENFDSQIVQIDTQTSQLKSQLNQLSVVESDIKTKQNARTEVAGQVEDLRTRKSAADARVVEKRGIAADIESRTSQINDLRAQLAKLPTGFNQARYRELQKVGEDLRPVREKSIALKSALGRREAVQKEVDELSARLSAKSEQIAQAEKALVELAFQPDTHEKLVREFETSSANLNAAQVQLERQRGEVNTAGAILQQIENEEQSLKTKLEQLKSKREERLHLQTLAEAFDKLRAELNDRIRPELEAVASELLSTMTDGRYDTLEINEQYAATIRDDGELKPVISGGEDDVVNLSLRLAISQMIADRAGQSFSLLVLDEVFGSLDENRRDNVVALLQSLKNRFEQIILITHVESIHDEVDNCIWVSFDEKTKTSRLVDRSELSEQSAVGILNG